MLGASSLVVLITEPCSFNTKFGVPESKPGWVPNDLVVVFLVVQTQVLPTQPQAKVVFCKGADCKGADCKGADFKLVEEVDGRVDEDDFKDGNEDEVEVVEGFMFIVLTLLSSFSKEGTPLERPEELLNGAVVAGARVGGMFVEVDKGTPVAGTTGAP